MKRVFLTLAVVLITTISFSQNNQTIEEIEVIAPTCKSDFFKYQDTPDGMDPFTFYINEKILAQAEQMEFRNGKVIVDFVVHEDGSISDFAIKNSVSNANNKAVIYALKTTSGYWTAGHNNGTATSMEKRIVIDFVDSEKSTLVALAQKSYRTGIKKYYSAQALESSKDEKSNKKMERNLKSAIYHFNNATRYVAQDATIIYYELKTYRALNNEQMINQKEAEYNLLVTESKQKNADYMAVNF